MRPRQPIRRDAETKQRELAGVWRDGLGQSDPGQERLTVEALLFRTDVVCRGYGHCSLAQLLNLFFASRPAT